jgi:hypothetical protein
MKMVPEKASITSQHHCPQHPHHAQPQYRSAEVTLSHYFMEATEFQPLGQPGFIKTKWWTNNQSNITRKFDIHVTVHHDKFLTIKPTTCINFSNLFWEWNSACFRQFLCLSSGVFHCTHSSGIRHTGLLTACGQDQDGVPSWPCSQAISKPVWHVPLLCVQWNTPDDDQRNCPKHIVSFQE